MKSASTTTERQLPRSKKRDRMKEVILQTSAALFAAEGFDKVSMRDIAESAEVGLPTIYKYFKDKQELYRQTVLSKQLVVGVHYLPALTKIKELSDFRVWLEAILKGNVHEKDFIRLLCRELLSDDPFLIKEMTKPFQPFYQTLRSKLNLMHEGSGDGGLPILLLSATLGYAIIHPFRENLENYAPALSKDDLEAEEQKEIIDYLYCLIQALGLIDRDSERKTENNKAELDLLRAAVLELTMEKMKMQKSQDNLDENAV